MSIDPDQAWAAFEARDRASDGRFVGAVRTTGIYCKPSCPARHPRRENVAFYPDGAAARAAGFRACLRCRPDEVARDRVAVEAALRLLDTQTGLSLDLLAAHVGYAPHHFHRLFKRATGVTPAAWARGVRANGAVAALREEDNVTDAIYAAGYSAPSRFYADAGDRLGMTPSAWRNGGRGVVIRWAVADTALGTMLLAATERGICRLSFDEDASELERRFPHATIEPGGEALAALVEGTVAACADPARMAQLPLDIAGTAFQQRVWEELRRIPAGETRSYAALAAAAGNPRATRAAGSACGANQVAVLIPCHRATRSDGSLGGYAYGLDRKRRLLERERG
ncbi:MAG: bifunctional DNA-binding transcriptional regulator/O6-methylguanine-DNA methyltransferase Ada [Sphingomonas bacterium]|uniref:bifunctional DNA-binding transcriptional regulator/O6-methylguanine-DNA methyltransferase Ada n=1 Tax=Sphingomonas bacterium TaxID=1895847 RepID=UPI00261FF903|nr:bifunctional DNA-binding transcriptional regulator/O6-methylguanine-DNA methyltransferase Ada [Sphingomonas bacterium]MDB5694583.1 bifunctional DNA-binding transcriptional regulator/O6-methylguanine-DNA methyltransferase Ada [Sphingomonas bacterium]